MLTVTTVFDPETRVLSYKEGSDRWAGTTEDNRSAQIVVEGIEALLNEYTAELVFGIPMYNNGVIYHPIGQIDAETQTYVLPNAILASARDGILPTELRLTKDSKVITSRNRLEISVVTAIDALRPFDGAYLPDILGRSQEWAPDVQYAKGAVVIRDEVLYYSRRADNLGHDPNDGNISWWREVSVVAIQEYQTYIGDGVSTQFTVAHHMLSPDLQFTVSHNGTDLTGDVTDMTAIDENTASFTFSSPPPADTLLRINEAYRAISSPMWVWGMLESEEGMVAPEALFGVLEITDEKVTVRNGELGVNSSGRAYAGPEGLTKVLANEEDLEAHIIRTDNPHSVTKEQLGLQNVDPTSDLNKPISIATQTALNLKANSSDLTAHTGNTSNPHSVTKAQVGLSNVDNTSDTAKPISTATQTALNAKQDTITGGATTITSSNLATSRALVSDGSGKVTVSDVTSTELGYLDGVTSAVQTQLNRKADAVGLNLHRINTTNPHSVTKKQVGLEFADNTADVDKPISTATQTALNLKANSSDLTAHTGNTSNPHSVTKAQVGLSAVANELQYSASNPPPYPVTSVAGKTGAVTLAEADIPALGAGKITSGTFADARIPALAISKITGLQTALDGKQDTLTFDNVPVSESANPVKSGGVYDALADKQDKLTFDDVPTSDSDNPVKSGGVYDALQAVGGEVLNELINILIPPVNCADLLTMYKGDLTLTESPVINASGCTSLEAVFRGCTNLKTVKYIHTPDVVIMDYMFRDCSSLTSIPELDTSNVTGMSQMFFMCSSLTSVPALDVSKVTRANHTFYRCSSLTSVTFIGDVVPPYGIDMFYSTPIASGNGYIFVPDDMVDEYKAASGWSAHASIIKGISEKEGLQSNISSFNLMIKENPTMFALTEEEIAELEEQEDLEK